MKRRAVSSAGERVVWLLFTLTTLAACAKDEDEPRNPATAGSAGSESGGTAGSGGTKGSTELVAVPNDQDEFPIAEAEGPAPKPPMGWNSWNSYASRVSAELIQQVADIMVSSGMRDAGYTYVNIDDGWALRERVVSETDPRNSTIEPDPVKFPPSEDGRNGIQVVADYVHERGLKLGIYSDRGTATCGGFAASGDHEAEDAQAFANWGVDYLKYDSCFAPMDAASREAQYRAMGDALLAVQDQHPILYSLCSWQFDEWNADVGQLWRTTGDIGMSFNDPTRVPATSLTVLAIASLNTAYAAYTGPNGWNDPDMLEVGNLGNHALGDTESRTHFNLWAIMSAPLIAGNKLDVMNETTRAILTNREVIAVDQDELGLQGVPVRATDATSVWAKPLNRSGARAVLLMNADDVTRNVGFELHEIGLDGGRATLRDLWVADDAGRTITNTHSVDVPAHGSMMYVVDGNEPRIPKGTAYLSELTWTYAANGLGPAEVDQSNGGRTAADGKPLSLRGQTFAKGLGVSAGSKIIYRLAKRCSTFSAVVGVDDTANGGGSVRFQVIADGEILYPSVESPPITGQDAPQEINVDVRGKHRLTLLVTSAGDGALNDRADWADAKLTCTP
jgi:alpha-galactosidase